MLFHCAHRRRFVTGASHRMTGIAIGLNTGGSNHLATIGVSFHTGANPCNGRSLAMPYGKPTLSLPLCPYSGISFRIAACCDGVYPGNTCRNCNTPGNGFTVAVTLTRLTRRLRVSRLRVVRHGQMRRKRRLGVLNTVNRNGTPASIPSTTDYTLRRVLHRNHRVVR